MLTFNKTELRHTYNPWQNRAGNLGWFFLSASRPPNNARMTFFHNLLNVFAHGVNFKVL